MESLERMKIWFSLTCSQVQGAEMSSDTLPLAVLTRDHTCVCNTLKKVRTMERQRSEGTIQRRPVRNWAMSNGEVRNMSNGRERS